MLNPWPPDQVASAPRCSTQSNQYGERHWQQEDFQPRYLDQYLPEFRAKAESSSLFNWDGASSDPSPAAVASPSCSKHILYLSPLGSRALTNHEQLHSISGAITRLDQRPVHPINISKSFGQRLSPAVSSTGTAPPTPPLPPELTPVVVSVFCIFVTSEGFNAHRPWTVPPDFRGDDQSGSTTSAFDQVGLRVGSSIVRPH